MSELPNIHQSRNEREAEGYTSASSYIYENPDDYHRIQERATELIESIDNLLQKDGDGKTVGVVDEITCESLDFGPFEFIRTGLYESGRGLMDLEECELANGDTVEDRLYGDEDEGLVIATQGASLDEARLHRLTLAIRALELIAEDARRGLDGRERCA